MSEPELGLDEFLLGPGELVGTVVGAALSRVLSGEEPLDGRDILRVIDAETSVLGVPDDALFVDEDAIRDSPEIEFRGCQPIFVDDGR
ncbi:MAG: hypothetical protein R2849_16385 [Thermomicrobiales bacterium]